MEDESTMRGIDTNLYLTVDEYVSAISALKGFKRGGFVVAGS